MKPVRLRRSKVTDDNGVTRSKVPAPILKTMGAESGDYLEFEVSSRGRVVMKVLKKRVKRASTRKKEQR